MRRGTLRKWRPSCAHDMEDNMQKQDYKTVREIADIEKYIGTATIVSFDFETSATDDYRKEEWAALDAHKSNITGIYVRTDPAGNVKPDKEKSTERIDGAVATIMALDRALRNEGSSASVYDNRGILFI